MGAPLPWVDFDLLAATGRRLSPPGPPATRAQRAECVAELREAAELAPALVARETGLPLVEGGTTLVVDRRTWVDGLADTGRRLWQELGAPTRPTLAQRVQGRALGAQVGAVAALMGRRILGQYDPFHERLLLVAPTVMHVERELGLVPRDFRHWVALHEQTHRVQFAAAPWLPAHLLHLVRAALQAEDSSGDGLRDVVARVVREGIPEESDGSLVDVVSAPAARGALDEVTGIMSLLEGHADVVMDLAGPEVVGTLDVIRRRFDARRGSVGPWARLIGMDAKLAQYRDGAAFCRAVIDDHGHEGLNRVFDGPDLMPRRSELADAAAWAARVLGGG